MNNPVELAHIVFRTKQTAVLADWYCRVLDAEIVSEHPGVTFLSYDSEHHRIALVSPEDLNERAPGLVVGFYHAAFTVANLRDLVDKHDSLQTQGIEPTRTINHGPTISFYYQDPDGNDIELQVDRFEHATDAKEWMSGEVFAKNPIGVLVDPADIRSALEAGVADEIIHIRPDEVQ